MGIEDNMFPRNLISTLDGYKSKSDTDIFDWQFNGQNSILDSSELFEIGGLMANI